MDLVGEVKTEEILASKVMCQQGLEKFILKPIEEGLITMASAWETIRMKRGTHV